jgi:uncharacterized protein
MRLRIFPRDESFFDLFEAAADNMVQSARLLDDLLQDFVDPELKAKRLVECEHEGDRITPRHPDPAQLHLHHPL